jgi:acyl-CoA thioesterase-1
MGGSSDAIKAGATQAGVPFVDVVTLGWFTEENRPAFAHTDGSHLNTAGHQYLAEQLEAWLASN